MLQLEFPLSMKEIIEIAQYTIPSLITGIVAYYFFLNHTKSEERKIKLQLLRETKKEILPLKLQAYERMTLFLERMNLSNLILRIPSVNNDKSAYATGLINTIEQEFEHNLAQQIYISAKCWNIIVTAKNATIGIIKKNELNADVATAQDLKESILKAMISSEPPSHTALGVLKEEVKDLL